MNLTGKDRKQLIVVVGLLLIFAIASKDSLGRLKHSREKLKKASATRTFAATGVITPGITQAAGTEETGLGPAIDPFSGRPISIGVEEGVSSFRLSGIVFNPNDPADSYAIINNKPFKVGDTIPNTKMKITDISMEEAVISDGADTKRLRTW